MSKQERFASMEPAPASRATEVGSARLGADGASADEAPDDTAAVAVHNPFASFEPSGVRDTQAATKLYEVPPELIEIARAHADAASASGTTTPLAPRPDVELEATLRAYTARLSSKPARVPVELMAATLAPEPGAELEPEPMPLTARRRRARRAAARDPAQARRASRAWLVYAALCVMGLASCAHVLLGS